MGAFEKWKPVNGYGESSLDAIAEQAFRAGMAEGIKEGMRRAAELVGHYTSEDGEIAAETILKEAGE